jgi:RNA polymerase sigma factor (sigma-70 family)
MPADSILRRIRHLFSARADAGATDADLLRRFADVRDEAAFELLVWRHAALVLHVCRQMLRDEHAVEDAFQATFLVLCRKAGSISNREALPGWLHQVAFRIAKRARPRRLAQTGIDLERVPAPLSDEIEADTRRMLHEEIASLPAKYRLPIVCCYLEGKTLGEVAAELGWPKGTVAGRLSRARDLLHHRLAARGVTLAGLGLASHLSASALSAGMTHRITALLVALRSLGASALSPSVVILAEGVLNAMFWKSMQWVAVAVVLVGGLSFGGGMWAVRPGVAQEEAAPRPPAVAKEDKPPAKAAQPDDLPKGAARIDVVAVADEAKPVQPDDPVKEAANRALARRNLRTLANAIGSYDEDSGHLPAPAVADKDGKPLLSWRVAILPWLGERKLFAEFKQDEPWDSAHNKKLLAKMPRVFAPVGVKTRLPNSTFYQVFVGPGALYRASYLPEGGRAGGGMRPAPRPPTLRPINNAIPANTILVVEAGTPVPWTKPEDIPYDPKKPIPALGGQFANVFHAAFGDGRVHTLTKTLDPAIVRYGIKPGNDQTVGDWDNFDQPDESPVQQKLLDDLRRKNFELGEEAAILKTILGEVKTELKDLRWALEQKKMLAADPTAKHLKSVNETLEKAIKEGRDEARKLMQEIRKVKEEMKKKGEK